MQPPLSSTLQPITELPAANKFEAKSEFPVQSRKARCKKRTWGIFYTPRSLIAALTKWAVRKKDDTILEPSFGGCGFLAECAARLQFFGAENPWKQMCGCDIDSQAFGNLPDRFKNANNSTRFIRKNFLETKPSDYIIKKYSIIIGNPPYVSRHNMRKYQLESAKEALLTSNITLAKHASLWAYFVIHSLQFLAIGGRMAWVLPRSLTQGFYGKQLLENLLSRFEKVRVISLQERVFITEGAEELVDVLLCDCFSPDIPCKASLAIEHADSTSVILKRRAEEQNFTPSTFRSGARLHALAPSTIAAFNHLRSLLRSSPIADKASAKIGIVTGATSFFVLKKEDLLQNNLLDSDCVFLLTKFRQIRGLILSSDETKNIIAQNNRVLLVRPNTPRTIYYWDKMPTKQRQSIKTFKKRVQWNAPDDNKIPDAFFPPLVDSHPRIILNDAKVNSSNTVHRVYFHETVESDHRHAIALSFLTTFVQVSCELTGRQCGSGGLKFEPSDFGLIEIPHLSQEQILKAPKICLQVDAAIKRGDFNSATVLADNWLFGDLYSELRLKSTEALTSLRRIRARPK